MPDRRPRHRDGHGRRRRRDVGPARGRESGTPAHAAPAPQARPRAGASEDPSFEAGRQPAGGGFGFLAFGLRCPAVRARFRTTIAAEAEILAVVSCLGESAARTKLKISASLKDKLTFADIPVGLTVLSENPVFGGKRFLVRLKLPAVETDEYLLRLIAEDPETGTVAEIARDYLIEKTDPAGSGGRR